MNRVHNNIVEDLYTLCKAFYSKWVKQLLSRYFVKSDFQLKCMALVACSLLSGIILVGIPSIVFFYQNHEIFSELALKFSPNIFEHLEQEKSWYINLLFSTSLALLAFFSFVTYRFTQNALVPIENVRRKLIHLSLDQNQAELLPHLESTDFKDLTDAYNYLAQKSNFKQKSSSSSTQQSVS